MDAPALKALLADVEEGARRAGRILADRFEGERTVELKGGIDLVTDADKASEEALLAFIAQRYPGHAVLSEESGVRAAAAGGAPGVRWIVDPLDGTTNYSHRVPHFCVSVGVEDADGLLAGAVLDPLRGELFSAARGHGATLNGRPLRVSSVDALSRALLCTGFPYDVRERPEAPVGLFNHFIRKAQGIRRMGAAALDLAYVAAGRYDGFFEFSLKPWDIAAGALLIQEAGGVVRRIDGAPLDLAKGHLFACARTLEPDLARETAAFLGELGWKV